MSEAHSESEASRYFFHMKLVCTGKKHRGKKKSLRASADSVPFGTGRDPVLLMDSLTTLSKQLGWGKEIQQSNVILDWANIAGESVAEHTEAIDLKDGVLSVRCNSTAWTTQLRLLRNQILEQISKKYPDAKVETIRFVGPDVPSWKHGLRSVQGRGQRDTYG